MNPVVHFELPASDSNRLSNFYADVFGWQIQMLDPDMGEYVLVSTTENGDDGMPKNPGAINGGFYKKSTDLPVQHPSLTISVDDIEEAITEVENAGDKFWERPMIYRVSDHLSISKIRKAM
ncbi:VOC family protein [Fodinibius sp. Rm-B-1B1-1]|uniref:VOC family protein n=1 Tax=Fodinibius alkaliphilus TaxID=3140241 RepID=UPI00315A693A